MLKKEKVRIILLHNPYTQSQQKFVDAICKNSIKIIGQVLRENKEKAAIEVKRLLDSHHEPFVKEELLQYVVLGQQRPKNRFNIH